MRLLFLCVSSGTFLFEFSLNQDFLVLIFLNFIQNIILSPFRNVQFAGPSFTFALYSSNFKLRNLPKGALKKDWNRFSLKYSKLHKPIAHKTLTFSVSNNCEERSFPSITPSRLLLHTKIQTHWKNDSKLIPIVTTTNHFKNHKIATVKLKTACIVIFSFNFFFCFS